MYGKVPANGFQSGHVPANAMTINVYDIDNVLVHSFPSQVAANWLGVSNITVSRYIKSGMVWNNQYIKTLVGFIIPSFIVSRVLLGYMFFDPSLCCFYKLMCLLF
jgi:hypothetical protein